jgi:hypothetical protein
MKSLDIKNMLKSVPSSKSFHVFLLISAGCLWLVSGSSEQRSTVLQLGAISILFGYIAVACLSGESLIKIVLCLESLFWIIWVFQFSSFWRAPVWVNLVDAVPLSFCYLLPSLVPTFIFYFGIRYFQRKWRTNDFESHVSFAE